MKKTLITLSLALFTSSVMAEMDHSKMDHGSMAMKQTDTMNMAMDDMSEVGMPAKGAKPDDVVQFVVMNTGKIEHEFSIGSAAEQLKHREMMRQMGNHKHDGGSAVTVAPGKAKQLLWHFHGDNNVEFACNIPGHAEAGMIKKIQLQ